MIYDEKLHFDKQPFIALSAEVLKSTSVVILKITDSELCADKGRNVLNFKPPTSISIVKPIFLFLSSLQHPHHFLNSLPLVGVSLSISLGFSEINSGTCQLVSDMFLFCINNTQINKNENFSFFIFVLVDMTEIPLSLCFSLSV